MGAGTLAVYLSETTPPATDSDVPPVILLLAGAVAVLAFISNQNSKQKDAAARARIRAMTEKEIYAKEREILAALERQQLDRRDATVSHLSSEIGEEFRVTRILIERLIDLEQVRILPSEARTSNDQDSKTSPTEPSLRFDSVIQLMLPGATRLRHPPSEVNVGRDYISTGDNSPAIRDSVVVNSFNNTYEQRYGAEILQALKELESIVRSNGKAQDIDLLEGFLDEARADRPNRSILRTAFEALQASLPAVSGVADLAIKLHPLWSYGG